MVRHALLNGLHICYEMVRLRTQASTSDANHATSSNATHLVHQDTETTTIYSGVNCPSLGPASVFPLILIAQLQLYREQRCLLDH